mgnify:FL=1
MSFTFSELLDKLKSEDETTLLELLDLTSLELVDYLEDVIFREQEKLREYYGEDESSLDWQEE